MQLIPEVSVIIPSFNRCEDLKRALGALKRQTYPVEHMEVLVMLDGSTDGSADMIQSLDIPYPLRVIHEANRGLTRVRNAGAEAARGRVLIYLDDDIEALPGMVSAYMQAHADRQEKLVIGYSPPVIPDPPGWLGLIHRMWWEDAFQNLGTPGWRFGYQDLMGCNFSITRSLYLGLGGMDDSVSSFSREDWEFAVRLVRSGAHIEYSRAACGRHHVSFSIGRGLLREMQEGRAETRMARVHPDIWPTLKLAQPGYNVHLMSKVVRWLAFTLPRALHTPIHLILKQITHFINAFYLHSRLFSIFYGINTYWYWRGAAEELGSLQELDRLKQYTLAHQGPCSTAAVNLAHGLAAAEDEIDLIRPDELEIFLDNILIGKIPGKPGGERLRGAHLRPYILENLANSLILALSLTARDQETWEDHELLRMLSARIRAEEANQR